MTQSAITSANPLPARDFRLDLWRGVALLMIFIDHIPGNILSTVTLKSFGFSDAAELFVFVAGYSSMLAYGRRFFKGENSSAVLRIFRRVGQLYLAHIALFVLVAGIVGVYAFRLSGADFDDPLVILPFITDPHTHLKHVLALRYVPKFLDILPLYIVLMASLPILLLLARIHILLCFCVSLCVYALGQNWDLQAWATDGSPHWTFNPIAWQFLFAIGVITARRVIQTGRALPRSKALIALSALIVASSALLAAPWSSIPGLEGWTVVDADFIYSFDKPNLSPVRLIHFLALAYLAAVIVPISAPFLTGRWVRPLIQVGRNSLPIFCLGTVLSIVGQLIFQSFGLGWPVQLAVDSVGFVTILAAGSMLSFISDRRKGAQSLAGPGGSRPVDGSETQGRPSDNAVRGDSGFFDRPERDGSPSSAAALRSPARIHTP
jgi:hypothetical protein